MTLSLLLDASPVIRFHVAAAVCAIIFGPLAMLRRSRDIWHRWLGRVWVAAMAAVALSSFLINEGRLVGPFSAIHLLSVYTLWGLWQSVAAARAGRIAAHRKGMLGLYVFAIGVAGLFTLLPGRRMSAVLFPDAPLAGFVSAAIGLVVIGLTVTISRGKRGRVGG